MSTKLLETFVFCVFPQNQAKMPKRFLHRNFPKFSESVRTHPKASRCIRMHPNASECIPTHPNVSERIPTDPNMFKTIRKRRKVYENRRANFPETALWPWSRLSFSMIKAESLFASDMLKTSSTVGMTSGQLFISLSLIYCRFYFVPGQNSHAGQTFPISSKRKRNETENKHGRRTKRGRRTKAYFQIIIKSQTNL